MTSLWAIGCVWLRYFDVFRKNLAYGLFSTFMEPMLFLLSFGFGVGKMVPNLQFGGVELTYRQFVMIGVLGQTVLFQSFFEAAYGSFVRMYYQKIFHAMAVTPITLGEVLWGELLWDSSKSLFASVVVLAVGVAIGDFSLFGALLCVPVVFFAALLFAALGLISAAKSRSIDAISYPQYIVVFPMFLFCGVFFPLTNLPWLAQQIVQFLPLSAFLSITRALALGTVFEFSSVLILMAWFIFLVPFAHRSMKRRMVA